MKRPMSVIVITRDPKSLRETHHRFDVQTGFPKLSLLGIFLKAFFSVS